MDYNYILDKLPYGHTFLFVDRLLDVHEDGVRGRFTFRPDFEFYSGHFKDMAVTPGVILTECCAQIGLVCLGIHLTGGNIDKGLMALTSTDMEFYQPVFPGELVEVVSEKEYFRFGKLKCKVRMYKNTNDLVCKGMISGMLKTQDDEK